MLRLLKVAAVLCVVAVAVFGCYTTRDRWLPLLQNSEHDSVAVAPSSSAGGANEQVRLTKQARKNLRLTSMPLVPTTYWRSIEIPGVIVDRPGVSDRGVVAPVSAVVTKIHHYAGETVLPGEPLVTLRLVSESFQISQIELYKAVEEKQITQAEIDRLSDAARSGAVPRSTMIDLNNELRRLDVSIRAYRQDLQIRGLNSQQIEAVTKGDFTSEIIVYAPATTSEEVDSLGTEAADGVEDDFYEVQRVEVELGHHVQAGQKVATLSRHHSLFIEGRAFRQEIPLVQRAAEGKWPIRVELLQESEHDWEGPLPPVTVHHISNTLNDDRRTISFFCPLKNQARRYERDGQSLYLWRFRPGQRVTLHVDVEEFNDVFVVPADAVLIEGPETYLFRQNGDFFDRKPVHVLHQTREEAVIANDGSVPPGIYVTKSGAVQLNRVLQSQSDTAPAGVHVHADGSVHANH
ncbi:efflux RND transporter periplasmic adaptor subunit [Stratiformator vulcanicus]|uniref:HlyD family secretion protein n=1 Tax=Stratiformator vulcanicus TaxID=2527980 RepID=A0A517R1B2_9PLAN|nr:hypothetical protein [Stratiformator vulcanicus]QDT37695.1 HlyD family secretion protein [Stratiformator vulcanicus]